MSILTRLWSPVEVERLVAAPPAAVYAAVSDPTTYPRWLVGAQRIRSVDPGFPAPGTAFHHSVGPVEEATVDDRSESIAADPPHRLVLDVHVGPLDGTVEFLLSAADDGTRVVFRETPRGLPRLALPGLRPVLHARNTRSIQQLAAVVEGAAP